MRRRDKGLAAMDVVESVARQSEQAAALAQIVDQDRLADPLTNPAVRPHLDRLRDTQHVKALDAQDARDTRRLRVADKRAAHAEKTLEVLQAARQMSSPARSVMALHKGRRRFMGLALTASVALAVGSATGPGDLAHKYAGHSFIGWIAEIGLTGLSTMAIMYRSHLGEHGGGGQFKTPSGGMSFQAKVLMALAVVPLVVSVVANAVAHGAIGVMCSLGAAAFGVFAHVISGQSSAALQAKAKQVTGTDEAQLHAAAMGHDPLTATVRAALAKEPAGAPPVIEQFRAQIAATARTPDPHQTRTDTPYDTPEDGAGTGRTGLSARPVPHSHTRVAGALEGHDGGPAGDKSVDRDHVVAVLAGQLRDAIAAGEKWAPDYKTLMEATGFRRSWCEKVVRDARRAVSFPGESPTHMTAPADTRTEDRTDTSTGTHTDTGTDPDPGTFEVARTGTEEPGSESAA